jgi:hypothetical protein
MLHTCSDMLGLNASYHSCSGLSCKVRVFGIIFEVTAAERASVNVAGWWTFGEHYRETKAGNDIKMAAGYPDRVKEAYEKGFITEEEIRLSAKRILSVILRID